MDTLDQRMKRDRNMLLQRIASANFPLDFASYVTRFLEDARTRRAANANAERGFFLRGGGGVE